MSETSTTWPGPLELEWHAGLDLSAVADLTAIGLVGIDGDGIAWARVWLFMPRDRAVEKEKSDRVPYTTWAREGWLTLTEGNVVDFAAVYARLKALHETYRLVSIGVDGWQAEQIKQQLGEIGVDVVGFGQGYASMSYPAKEYERRILARTLRHEGNPVMRWMVGNCVIEQDAAGNIKPSKKKSTQRIDGVVGQVMALGRCLVAEAEGESVYEQGGITVL